MKIAKTEANINKMSRLDMAEYLVKRCEEMKRALRHCGSEADIEDAISEVVCKLMGVEVEGRGLYFANEIKAKNERELFAYLKGQVRGRLSKIQRKQSYWRDADLFSGHEDKSDCDPDDRSFGEMVFMKTMERGEGRGSDDYGPIAYAEPLDEDDSLRSDDVGVRSEQWRLAKAMKQRRIRNYMTHEQLRLAKQINPDIAYGIDSKALGRILFAELKKACKEHHIKWEKGLMYFEAAFKGKDNQSIVKKMHGEVTKKELDALVNAFGVFKNRIQKYIRKGAADNRFIKEFLAAA